MFNKNKNSIFGALIVAMFGLLLIPGSIALHAWNEYRTIHRSRGLAEASSSVQTIADPQIVASELDGKLVHLTGKVETKETLVDEKFGIRADAVRLARRVQMFQWTEDKRTNDGKTTYSYDREWHSGRVSSDSFHRTNGHVNPRLPFAEVELMAEQVDVGAYELSADLKKQMNNFEPIEISEAAILETIGDSEVGSFLVRDNTLYWGFEAVDPDSPEIGDVKIVFECVPPGDVSLIAALRGNSFGEYKTSNGEPIERLYPGIHSSEEVVSRLMTENTMMAWGMRILGFVMCAMGFALMFGPFQAMVGWIPLIGGFTRGILFLIGVVLALIISLTTISISWIAVRPLLGVALLLISALLGYVLIRLRRSTTEEPQVIDASMLV